MRPFSTVLNKALGNYKNAQIVKLNMNTTRPYIYNTTSIFNSSPENIKKISTANINDETLGFILTRHVSSQKTNNYWIECISRIRKFYPQSKIVIIDDNSNLLFLNETGVDLTNCTIIESEFKKRGELLPYYYFYKNKFFEKAIIIHDSVFIQYPIDVSNVKNVRFIWSFSGVVVEDNSLEKFLISKLNKAHLPSLMNVHDNKYLWNGCFGVMSVITHDFVSLLNNKYDFFNLLNFIDSRKHRCCLERVFAVICFNELKEQFINKPHLIGNIHACYPDYGYSYEKYQFDKKLNRIPISRPFLKVWTGR
jgi:hypothetical protein